MRTKRLPAVCTGLALLLLAPLVIGGEATSAATDSHESYTYATNGIKDHIRGPAHTEWKLLLDESNLGGKELEMVELTMPSGLVVPSHMHGSVEIIYVLSGTYEHEVNGKLYRLLPGMVGIVRPGDHVRHLVPKSGPAKVLIIWAPARGEANTLARAKGEPVSPVAEVHRGTASP